MTSGASGSGGTSGTHTGLRFNPRVAPEFLDNEDDGVGIEDPKKRIKQKAKKDEKKESREHKWAGLRHLKVKVTKPREEPFDSRANQEQLSEETGPASSRGTPLDQMTGARTGTGSSMMEGGSPVMGQYGLMRTGEPMDIAFRMLKDDDDEEEEKPFDRERLSESSRRIMDQIDEIKEEGRRANERYKELQESGFPGESGPYTTQYDESQDTVIQCPMCGGKGCEHCGGTGEHTVHPDFTGGRPTPFPARFNPETGFTMSEPMDAPFDLLRKKHTETLETVSARQRGQKAARTRKTRGKTTESYKTERRRKGKGQLRARTRSPKTHTTQSAGLKQTVGGTHGAQMGRRITGRRYKGLGRRPHISLEPRQRAAISHRSAVERAQPTQPITVPIPFQTGLPRYSLKPRGVESDDRPATAGPKKPRAPSQPAVRGGREMLEHKTPSAMSGGALMAMSGDIVDITNLLLKAPAQISQADLQEFKFIIRELKDLLRNSKLLQKNELEERKDRMDDPSPNAHPLQTSYATGATSVDPDDDPRYWGAHPLGLLVPRGGMTV